MNILICYMHESEQQMQSYEAMNMSTWIWNFWDLEEIRPRVHCSSGSGSGTKSDVRRWGFAGEDAGGRVRQGRARTRAAGAGA